MAGSSGGAKQAPMTRDLPTPRHDWTLDEVEGLFARPFMELVYEAATVPGSGETPVVIRVRRRAGFVCLLT